jgi:site-specific recombinase XerD
MEKNTKNHHSNETFVLRDDRSFADNDKLSLKSKRRMRMAKAENTLRAYEADWDDFFEWCRFHKLCSLPAEPETIVNYINDLADFAKANTVSRRVTAISENHIAAGFAEQNPAKSGLVRNAVEGIRREKGIMQHSKAPLFVEDLAAIAELCDGGDIVAIRDKALLFLGFAGAFRRSELVAIKFEQLTFSREGLIIFLPSSKSDQLGEGEYLAIPYGKNPDLCLSVP